MFDLLGVEATINEQALNHGKAQSPHPFGHSGESKILLVVFD